MKEPRRIRLREEKGEVRCSRGGRRESERSKRGRKQEGGEGRVWRKKAKRSGNPSCQHAPGLGQVAEGQRVTNWWTQFEAKIHRENN